MKLNNLFIASLYGTFFYLAGCSSDSSVNVAGGGDDFPNSIQTIGKLISENLNNHMGNPVTESHGNIDVPSSFTLESISVGVKKQGIIQGLSCDSTSFVYNIFNSSWTVIKRSCTDSTLKLDTMIIKINGIDTSILYAAEAVQNLRNNKIQLIIYSDLDGDSVLTGTHVSVAQAQVLYLTAYPDGRVESQKMGVDAGVDLNFATDTDNKIIFSSVTNTWGHDTTLFCDLTDADGDKFVVNNSSNDSGLVNIRYIQGRSDISKKSTFARFVTFPDDSIKNYPIQYFSEDISARFNITQYIREIHGDSTFRPHDTVDFVRVQQSLLFDSLGLDSISIRGILGSAPNDSSDDGVIGINIHRLFKKGQDREITFSFTTDTPVFAGQTPGDGNVSMKIVALDQSWIQVTGVVLSTGINTEIITSKGIAYSVKWDKKGELISYDKH
jgi:hypothetical protein